MLRKFTENFIQYLRRLLLLGKIGKLTRYKTKIEPLAEGQTSNREPGRHLE